MQAASLTIPFTLIAKKMGYRELVDYDKAGVVYPYNTITTLRQTPSSPILRRLSGGCARMNAS